MHYHQHDEQMIEVFYGYLDNHETWIGTVFFISIGLVIASFFIPKKLKRFILFSNIVSIILFVSVIGLLISHWLNVEEYPSSIQFKGEVIPNKYSGFPFHFFDTYPTINCYLCNKYVISISGVLKNLLAFQVISLAAIFGLRRHLKSKRIISIILLVLISLLIATIYILSRNHFVYFSI